MLKCAGDEMSITMRSFTPCLSVEHCYTYLAISSLLVMFHKNRTWAGGGGEKEVPFLNIATVI